MAEVDKNWKFLSGWTGKKPGKDLPAWTLDVLENRGIKTEQQISSFLEPKYEDLLDPSVFLNMDKAVERIALAKDKNEKIVVYGDYDVDGITTTALVQETLNKIGIQRVETYIPHREEEGYGLNENAVKEIIANGTNLIIAVDCGITSKDIISKFKDKVDFLVCDHHEIDEKKLPDAIIIHPALLEKGFLNRHPELVSGSEIPDPRLNDPQIGQEVRNDKRKGSDPNGIQLSACGMAFFLTRALQEKYPTEMPKGSEKWLLDLIALATICDVVPLTGQNRILAKFGLLVLEKSKRVGLRELIKVSNIDPKEINSYAVGFLLGPRLNAAGRLEHAEGALNLLMSKHAPKAREIAQKLNELNLERQKMCERILAEAKAEIEKSNKKDHEIFLLSNKNWPRGVVGIIASKLADSYSRPVIVFEHDGEEHHGSGRSIEGFDITQALSECEDCLIKYGGHAKAAGLSVKDEHFVVLSEKMLKIAKSKIKEEDLRKSITIDTKIKADEIDDKMLELISTLEPFGYGNKTPVFAILGADIENIKKVGSDGTHLKFSVKQSAIGNQKSPLSSIWFNYGVELSEDKAYDLACTLRYNIWNNRKSIELRIIDAKPSDKG